MDRKEWRRAVREEKGAGKAEEEKEAHDRAWQGRASRAHRGVFEFLHSIRGSAYAPHYLSISLFYLGRARLFSGLGISKCVTSGTRSFTHSSTPKNLTFVCPFLCFIKMTFGQTLPSGVRPIGCLITSRMTSFRRACHLYSAPH